MKTAANSCFAPSPASPRAPWLLGGLPESGRAAGVPPTSLTPDEALAKPKEGNARYVQSPELCAIDLTKRRGELAKGQAPWATILACADSRVPPELIFGGLNLGELFVCRNAGNTADTDVLGTIEYGGEHLGSPLIVVIGHSDCGAVKAACEVAKTGAELPGHIGLMVEAIIPAAISQMGKDGDFVANTVRENARRVAARIGTESDIVRHLVEAGKVKIVHAVYDLGSGAVEFIG